MDINNKLKRNIIEYINMNSLKVIGALVGITAGTLLIVMFKYYDE